MKYLKIKYDFTTNTTAGFAHMFNNVINIIITCYIKNFIPIIPKFSLGKIHGTYKITNFSEYYDYNNVTINGEKIKIVTDDSLIDKNNIEILDIDEELRAIQVRWHQFFFLNNKYEVIIKPRYVKTSVDVFNYLNIYNCFNHQTNKNEFHNYKKPDYNKLSKIELNLPFTNEIIEIGNKVINKYFKNNYICIHCRRGDDIGIIGGMGLGYLNKYTNPDNVLKKINEVNENNNYKNVFIMMHPLNKNSYDKSIFKGSNYNVYFSEDIEELSTSISDNNYLYCIESYIMEKANKKISTYRHWSNKFGNEKIYDSYLTEVDEENENNLSFPFMYYN